MDDLSDLNWSSKPELSRTNSTYHGLAPAFNVSDSSSQAKPSLTAGASQSAVPKAKNQALGDDGFSGLVSFNSISSDKNVPLLERQKTLSNQRSQQQASKKQQLNSLYNGGDDHFWNSLGSGRSTPDVTGQHLGQASESAATNGRDSRTSSSGCEVPTQQSNAATDDFLAAFSASTPVESSSYFPKPPGNAPVLRSADEQTTQSHSSSPAIASFSDRPTKPTTEDDDPFGLADLSNNNNNNNNTGETRNAASRENNDEDILGLFGEPAPVKSNPEPLAEPSHQEPKVSAEHSGDRVLAELIDMGFSEDNAKDALQVTGPAADIQQAVSWLLNKAHAEAKGKTKQLFPTKDIDDPVPDAHSSPHRAADTQSRSLKRSRPKRTGTSGQNAEPLGKDSAQLASELGHSFLKTAETFWKTSTQKVQQAVQEYGSDSDGGQPKWLRENRLPREKLVQCTVAQSNGRAADTSHTDGQQQFSVTDEALLLESDRPVSASAKSRAALNAASTTGARSTKNDTEPVLLQSQRAKTPLHERRPQRSAKDSLHKKATLNKQATEEQASQAYVSSSRRRPGALTPHHSTAGAMTLETASAKGPALQPLNSQPVTPKRRGLQPSISCRQIPSISATALQASHASREAGNSHFKRGDYDAAHQSYSTSIGYLTAGHPVTIVLFTNRALTCLKTGNPKAAIVDSDKALQIIGSSGGESEVIDFGTGEPSKPMRDYFGKALMRKAEALEQIEKWSEAAAEWKKAVEHGHGGATSIQGRNRCEKAAFPQPAQETLAQATKSPNASKKTRPVVDNVQSTKLPNLSSVAVKQLRAANAVADRVDDEKLALSEGVNTRLTAWKDGKTDNIRALLGSLETVLWPEAEWKKIGMAELVQPSKVKIQYMKGIAKVHPDKVCCPALAVDMHIGTDDAI